MTKPHKHAAVIKAWAEGKEIQFAITPPTRSDPMAKREPDWCDYRHPGALPGFNNEHTDWRIKPEPIEWQAEREAFARGEAIEYRCRLGPSLGWVECKHPIWGPSKVGEYRIAPRKWAKEREAFERGERMQWRSKSPQHKDRGWMDMPTVYAMTQFRRDLDIALNEPTNEFRIPHKWQEEMDAQARGEVVQFSNDNGLTWHEPGIDGWDFGSSWGLYRVKPKTMKTRVRVAAMGDRSGSGSFWVWSVHTTEEAAKIEGSKNFLCWLHEWKEVVHPAPRCVGVDLGSPGGDWTSITQVINDLVESRKSGSQPKPNQRFTFDGNLHL